MCNITIGELFDKVRDMIDNDLKQNQMREVLMETYFWIIEHYRGGVWRNSKKLYSTESDAQTAMHNILTFTYGATPETTRMTKLERSKEQ